MKEVTKLYITLVDELYFTDAELQLLTDINGYSIQTLNDAIYSRYGYRDLEQMLESEELLEQMLESEEQ